MNVNDLRQEFIEQGLWQSEQDFNPDSDEWRAGL